MTRTVRHYTLAVRAIVMPTSATMRVQIQNYAGSGIKRRSWLKCSSGGLTRDLICLRYSYNSAPVRDRGTYTAGTANAAPVFERGRQISYFAAPVFVTKRLAAILKIYKRLIRKTKNLLHIIQKAAENAKLG